MVLLLKAHSQLMVIGVISGARPSRKPAATSSGRGALTGSYVVCCHIVRGLVGCTVVSGPVTLPALSVRSKYRYMQISKHKSQSISI